MKSRLHFSFANLYFKKFFLQCSSITLRTASETNRRFVKLVSERTAATATRMALTEEPGQLRANNMVNEVPRPARLPSIPPKTHPEVPHPACRSP